VIRGSYAAIHCRGAHLHSLPLLCLGTALAVLPAPVFLAAYGVVTAAKVAACKNILLGQAPDKFCRSATK
jgi:hypothetical protein